MDFDFVVRSQFVERFLLRYQDQVPRLQTEQALKQATPPLELAPALALPQLHFFAIVTSHPLPGTCPPAPAGKALVFSQFTSMLDLCQHRLQQVRG